MKKVKKIIIFGTIIALGALWSYNGFANGKETYALLDNAFIHTYQDRDGIWVVPAKTQKSISSLMKEFGTNQEEFYQINQLNPKKRVSQHVPLFFPYSDEKMVELESEGKGREAVVSPSDKMVWPVIVDRYSRITSRIGRRWNKFHTGIDIACRRGTVIVAAADGLVESSGWLGHYGKAVRVYHPELSHTETLYAHNTHILVKKGEKVRKGQIIAYSGTTGRSTGPHLHFEVRYQNIFLNPEHFLPEFPDVLNAVANLE